MTPRAPSLQEVAALAGVSTGTVSRALSRPELLAEGTRTRVLAAVDRLGYVRHGAARALASRRTRTIGAVIPRLGASMFATTIRGLQRVLEADGYTLLLAHPADPSASSLPAVTTLLERGVDAVVLLGRTHDPALFERLRVREVPYVLIWALAGEASAHPAIGFDNRRAGRLVGDHLVALGHRRFAMISAPTQENERARDRFLGLVESLTSVGAHLPAAARLETQYGYREGAEAVDALVARDVRFTALVCGNDYLAVGALAALARHGWRVPHDVSVVGFNDSEFAPYTIPALTTVRFPIEAIGERAASYLVERLRGNAPIASVELPVELIVRDSTATPRRGPLPR
ncbi:MAG: LacI family DNA-binding transcriptional regulator [Burkholderiales bacterium]|nr:LacI family DNA-binding transcriptional regulator [Burkholderiales bacterium]